MLGFSTIGEAVIAGDTQRSASYAQAVTATISASVSQLRAIAKIVTVSPTFTKSVVKAITKSAITISPTFTPTVVKAVSKTVSVSVSTAAAVEKFFLVTIVVNVTTSVEWLFNLLSITSRRILQDPVDFVLAHTQTIEGRGHDNDIRAPNVRTSSRGRRSGLRSLGFGGAPSFTVKTGGGKHK